jgi:hypothetical protein
MAAPSTQTSRQVSEESAPTAGDWFREFLSTAGIDGLLGIWLLLAPFALAYGDTGAALDDIALGAVIAAAGFVGLADASRARTLAVVNGAAAAWLFVAALVLDQTAPAVTDDIVVATILASLALAGAARSRDDP